MSLITVLIYIYIYNKLEVEKNLKISLQAIQKSERLAVRFRIGICGRKEHLTVLFMFKKLFKLNIIYIFTKTVLKKIPKVIL